MQRRSASSCSTQWKNQKVINRVQQKPKEETQRYPHEKNHEPEPTVSKIRAKKSTSSNTALNRTTTKGRKRTKDQKGGKDNYQTNNTQRYVFVSKGGAEELHKSRGWEKRKTSKRRLKERKDGPCRRTKRVENNQKTQKNTVRRWLRKERKKQKWGRIRLLKERQDRERRRAKTIHSMRKEANHNTTREESLAEEVPTQKKHILQDPNPKQHQRQKHAWLESEESTWTRLDHNKWRCVGTNTV